MGNAFGVKYGYKHIPFYIEMNTNQIDEILRTGLPMSAIHPLPAKPEPPKKFYPSQCSQPLLREFMKEIITHPRWKKDSEMMYIMNQIKTRKMITGGNDTISDLLKKMKASSLPIR